MDDVTAWILERIPKEEDLELDALTELATSLGRERGLWHHLVRHDPNERVYAELYRDIHLDIWLVCWDTDQDTGVHDHDTSCGAVYVCDGELFEDRLVMGADGIRQASNRKPAGTAFDFPSTRIHCVRHASGAAVSVHCYSPALWRMGFYSFDDAGGLMRTSVTYADEMWARPSGLVADLRT